MLFIFYPSRVKQQKTYISWEVPVVVLDGVPAKYRSRRSRAGGLDKTKTGAGSYQSSSYGWRGCGVMEGGSTSGR